MKMVNFKGNGSGVNGNSCPGEPGGATPDPSEGATTDYTDDTDKVLVFE